MGGYSWGFVIIVASRWRDAVPLNQHSAACLRLTGQTLRGLKYGKGADTETP